MATKPTMDVYYGSGPAEYGKQMAAYQFEQGDTQARFIDPIRGNVLYSDYIKAPQTYLTEKFNAGAGSYGGTEGWTENKIPTATTAPTAPTGTLAGQSGMTTTDFAQSYKQQYGVAPTNEQLLAFTAQRKTGATLPKIVEGVKNITPESMQAPKTTDVSGTVPEDTGTTESAVSQAKGTAENIQTTGLLPEEKQEQTILDEMAKLVGESTGRGAEQAKLEQEAGIAQKKADLQNLVGQINSKIKEFEAFKLQQEGKPMTMQRYLGSIAQQQNKIASEVLLLQGQAQILQGNLNEAQDSINRAVDLKYQTIDNQYKIRQAQLAALQPSLDRAEKQKALNLQRQYEIEQKASDSAKATEKQKLDYVSGLMSKYPDAKISFTDSTADAQIKITGSKIYQDQIRLLGGKNVSTTSDWTPYSITTPPTPAKETFEQFLAKEEERIGQSLSQEKRDELRKQFDASQVVPTPNAQNADLSMYDWDVRQVILGNEPASSVTSGGTEDERSRAKKQLADAEKRGLLTQKFSGYQTKIITSINDTVSKNATYSKTTSMRTYADNVAASLSQTTGVGDIAAINQFQKVIDEGAVTRDQDVKLIQSSQSLLNTLKTQIKKLEKGEQLSPELRTQMRTATEAIYEAQVKALMKDPFIKAKTLEAKNNNIPIEETILGQLSTFETTDQSTITNPTGFTSDGGAYSVRFIP